MNIERIQYWLAVAATHPTNSKDEEIEIHTLMEKLEGCVVVPVEPTDEIIRAMQQSKKQFCKASAQLMYSAIVKAARGGNHV